MGQPQPAPASCNAGIRNGGVLAWPARRYRQRASARNIGRAGQRVTCWRSSGVRKEFPGVVALDDVPFQLRPRHRACADGREWRRQIDADEDYRRHLQAGRGRRCACAASADHAQIAARRARKRHRHDPSGTQPDAVHDGGGKHLDPPRAEKPLRLRRSRRNAPQTQALFDAAQHRYRSGNRGARPVGRQPADGRDRQGGVLRIPTS